MFSMAKIKGGGDYLGEYLCAADYYSEKEQVVGLWLGKGAERLGLRGEIHAGNLAFEALRLNSMPGGNGKLTARNGENRVRFFDFQCAGPKSVSVMGITLGDDRLIAAHDKAVAVAFSELEKFACCQANTRTERINRITGNVAAAQFRHTSSRALDPQIHTHVVTANATWDSKSASWKALNENEMLKAIRYAGKVYQNELAKTCLSLGYEIRDTRDGKGNIIGFELSGVSKEIIERFSKRRSEIEREITAFQKEHGREPTSREVGIMTRETRADKMKEISNAEVLANQRAQLSPSELASLQNLKARAVSPVGLEMNREREGLRIATSHIFERRSVAYGHEVLAEALNQHLGHIDLGKLTGQLAAQRLVPLSEDNRHPILGTAFATAKGLQQERWSVGFVNATLGKFQPLAASVSLSERLSEEQRRALKSILNCSDQVMALRGAAGVGKTTVLTELEKALKESGHTAWYCAPTSSAADTLRQEGISKATTVSDFTVNVAVNENLKGVVLVVDEAGLASNKQGAELLRIAARNDARVLFVGDARQHTSVEAGDFLRVLETHSKIASAEILSVRRQTVAEYREAVQEMAQGSVREGLERLDSLGWIKESKAGYLEAAAKDYLKHFGDGKQANAVIGVTPSWEENHILTGIIRQDLKARALLGKGTPVVVYESMQWTAAQKETNQYEKGMVVVFNRKSGSYQKGDTVEVVGSEKGVVRVVSTVEGEAGKVRTLRAPLECFDVARKREIEIAPGDRLLIRANDRKQNLINGDLVTVDKMVGERIQATDGRSIDLTKFRSVTHGYVVTSHKSQSKTADHVVVGASQLDEKAAYVACSRGRLSCSVHTPNKEQFMGRLPAGNRLAALDLAKSVLPSVVSVPSQSVEMENRKKAWAIQVPMAALGIARLVRMTPSALCIEGVMKVAGWTFQWWREQAQRTQERSREIQR